MSEIKYLSDGRKVSVLGKINQTEYIVQEIFVTDDGSEIPSGENFTAKALHETPVKSWKEKEAEKVEARHQKAKDEIKSLEKEVALLKGRRQGYSDILRQNEKFISLFNETDAAMLCDIVTGNIEYMLPISEYSSPFEIIHIEDGLFCFDRSYYDDVHKYEGLKMVQVLALQSSRYQSDRRCRVEVSRYYDGSGGNREYRFFKTKEEVNKYLLEKMNEYLDEDKLTLTHIQKISKFIVVSDEIIKRVGDKELERLKTSMETNQSNINNNYKKQVEQLQASIDAITNL